MTTKANMDIRSYAKAHKIKLWQISEGLGLAADTVFYRQLRHELPDEQKTRIFKIIDQLSAAE